MSCSSHQIHLYIKSNLRNRIKAICHIKNYQRSLKFLPMILVISVPKTAKKHRKRNDNTLISTRVRVQDSLSDVKN